MADVNYRVLVSLEQTGDLAGITSGKLADLDKGVSKIGSGLKNIGGTISDAFTGAVEKVAEIGVKLGTLGAGMAAAATTFGLKFNDEMEQTKISLASIFSAQGISKDMNDGLTQASDVMKKMRIDAQALPGTFSELNQIMKTISIPGFQSGMSTDRLEQFSAQTMAVAKIAGVSIPVAAREMATLMSGHATSANVMALRLGISGDKAKEFRQMSPEERIQTLTTELGKYKGAIDTFSSSFDALSTTLKDNALLFLGKATEPLFAKIKNTIGEANTWFSDHKILVEEFAYDIGTKLADAWDYGVKSIKEWFPVFVSFGKDFLSKMRDVWREIEPIAAKIASYIKEAMTHSEQTFSKIESILKVYAALKIGGEISPIFEGAGKVALGGARLAGAGGLGGAAGMAAGGAVAAGAALSIGGAIDILSDKDNILHEGAMKNMKGLEEDFLALKVGLSGAAQQAREFADILGDQLITGLRGATHLTKMWVDSINNGIDFITGNWRHKLGPDEEVPIDRNSAVSALIGSNMVAMTGRAVAEATKKVTGGGGTTIGRIDIIVQQQGDPDRVARAVLDKLADLKRYRKSSPFVPSYGSGK